MKNEPFESVLKEELGKAASLQDVARRAGIEPAMLSKIKGGHRDAGAELRTRLAVALTGDIPSALNLADKFLNASPVPRDYQPRREKWKKDQKSLILRYFQTEFKSFEIGLPLFFDTAPLLICERLRFFDQVGLNVKFHHLRWPDVPNYFEQESSDSTIRLSIYNRQSVKVDAIPTGGNLRERVCFLLPIAIYPPDGFAFFVRRQHANDFANPEKRLKTFLESFDNQKPWIIVSGTDMELGMQTAIRKALSLPSNERVSVNIFHLDPFEALRVFLHTDNWGDGIVPGIPQRMILEKQGKSALFTGNEIGLSTGFNGFVGLKRETYSANFKKAVAQITWGWYKGLAHIQQCLPEAAQIVVDEMNRCIREPETRWTWKDFCKFWTEKEERKLFLIPNTPESMLSKIDYTFEPYDRTSEFIQFVQQTYQLI